MLHLFLSPGRVYTPSADATGALEVVRSPPARRVAGCAASPTCKPQIIRLPLDAITPFTPWSRQPLPPTCDWKTFAAWTDIEDAELAGALLDLTSAVSARHLEGPVELGYDQRVVKYWILDEECRGLRTALRTCAQQLSRCSVLRGQKRDRAGRSAAEAFISFVDSRHLAYRSSFVCWHCNEATDHGDVCKGCRCARYCSSRCQAADWLQHAQYCKKSGAHARFVGWKGLDDGSRTMMAQTAERD